MLFLLFIFICLFSFRDEGDTPLGSRVAINNYEIQIKLLELLAPHHKLLELHAHTKKKAKQKRKRKKKEKGKRKKRKEGKGT